MFWPIVRESSPAALINVLRTVSKYIMSYTREVGVGVEASPAARKLLLADQVFVSFIFENVTFDVTMRFIRSLDISSVLYLYRFAGIDLDRFSLVRFWLMLRSILLDTRPVYEHITQHKSLQLDQVA